MKTIRFEVSALTNNAMKVVAIFFGSGLRTPEQLFCKITTDANPKLWLRTASINSIQTMKLFHNRHRSVGKHCAVSISQLKLIYLKAFQEKEKIEY